VETEQKACGYRCACGAEFEIGPPPHGIVAAVDAYVAHAKHCPVVTWGSHCGFCGIRVPGPVDGPLMQDHIEHCEKHPMAALRGRLETVEAELEKWHHSPMGFRCPCGALFAVADLNEIGSALQDYLAHSRQCPKATTICVWCGMMIKGHPTSAAPQEHYTQCQCAKHPMRALEGRVKELEAECQRLTAALQDIAAEKWVVPGLRPGLYGHAKTIADAALSALPDSGSHARMMLAASALAKFTLDSDWESSSHRCVLNGFIAAYRAAEKEAADGR